MGLGGLALIPANLVALALEDELEPPLPPQPATKTAIRTAKTIGGAARERMSEV
jgi:hypothetical protein